MLMTSVTIATLVGGVSGLVTRIFFAQSGGDLPGWLTTVGVGGSLSLIFWIVAKELPAFRQASKEAQIEFKTTLKEMASNFHDELATEREAARMERAAWSAERATERLTRHAAADALNAVALTVRDLSEEIKKEEKE